MVRALLIIWVGGIIVLSLFALKANWDLIRNYGIKVLDKKMSAAILVWPIALVLLAWYIFTHKK